jgi:tetratricopeptide (TPR) repeat protein
VSPIALLAGPVDDAILFVSYALVVALAVLVALVLIGLFPVGARLAPLYRFLGLSDLEWMALMRRSIRESEWIDMPSLEARFRRCVEIAVGARRRRLRSIALFALAYALINEARWDEASACLDESLTLARQKGRASDEANALRGTAALRGMRGDLDGAQPFLDQAAALLPRLRPSMVSAIWLDIGWMASQRGLLDDAMQAWTRSLDAAADPKLRHLARMSLLNIGWADVRDGRRAEGRAALGELITEARAASDLSVTAHALTALAAADWEDGDDQAARARAGESLDLLASRRIRLHAGEANSVLGLVEARAGNVAAAEERLTTAAPLVVTRHGRVNVADLLMRLGDIASRDGRTDDARSRYERAIAIHERWGTPERAAEARAALAELPDVGGPG